LQPSLGNTLIVAGNVSLSSWLYADNGGRSVLEGPSNTAGAVQVSGSGTVAEVNGTLTTTFSTTSNAVYSGATLTGTGIFHVGTAPRAMHVNSNGRVNPGTLTGPGYSKWRGSTSSRAATWTSI
jgi:hypothetical protein